ncbi:MAG TPA: hypothetical protein VLM38_00675 [Blastocatellia bacterium]|nr:hypothetical protein [Blastocatellia bacterium]
MVDLGSTLSIVLGFVTIVLVLSLIIQSLQNVIKRLLRMKARQAEQSLKMLFDYALTTQPTKYTRLKYASPILAVASKFLTGGDQTSVGDTLVEEVKREVLKMGRKSFWGSALLDSVTKDDLTKILNNLNLAAKDVGIDTAAIESALQAGQNLDQEVKTAIAEKIATVEAWYDTVMPGLAERYERGMKWMAVLLSVIVVLAFNADAIKIFKYVAADSAVQQQLIDYAQNRSKSQPAATEDQIKGEIDEISRLASDYRKFGLSPFRWDGFKAAPMGSVLGWVVMTLLLSLGAPFWEDALESVFSLKNTLRGKAKAEQSST